MYKRVSATVSRILQLFDFSASRVIPRFRQTQDDRTPEELEFETKLQSLGARRAKIGGGGWWSDTAATEPLVLPETQRELKARRAAAEQ